MLVKNRIPIEEYLVLIEFVTYDLIVCLEYER